MLGIMPLVLSALFFLGAVGCLQGKRFNYKGHVEDDPYYEGFLILFVMAIVAILLSIFL